MNFTKGLHRLTAAAVMASIIVTLTGHKSFAAWDGYDESDGSLAVVDMNIPSNIYSAGVEASADVVKTSKFSAHWNNSVSKKSILFSSSVPRDWSSYSKIEFWLYSAKAMPGAGLTLFVNSDPELASGTSTHQVWFTTEFEGWRLISIPLDEMAVSRNASFQKVNSVGFHTDWFKPFRNENLDVYIDSLRLVNGDAVNSSFTDECVKETEAAMKNSTVFHTKTSNVISNGKKSKLVPENPEIQAVEIDSVCYAPARVFKTYFGASVDEEKLTVAKGDKVYTGGKTVDGMLYVPVRECAQSLGYNAYEYEGLAVVGDGAEYFKSSIPAVYYAGVHVMYEELAPESVTQEDFEQAKENWRYYLVGDETTDLTDDLVKEKITSVTKAAKTAWGKMNKPQQKADEIGNLFGTKKMSTSNTVDLRDLYNNLNAMALAYGTYGSELYKSPELLTDILYGLEWGYNNAYGTNVLTGTGYFNGYGGNWYDWYITCPTGIAQTLAVIEKDIYSQMGETEGKELILKYLLPTHKFLTGLSSSDGSNLLLKAYAAIGVGFLEGDVKRVIEARDYSQIAFQYVENLDFIPYSATEKTDNGFHTDGSYVMHTKHAMTGSYGAHQIEYAARVISLVGGTKFKMYSPLTEHTGQWIINGYDPVMYKGGVMSMVTGRTRKTHRYVEKYNGILILGGMLDFLKAGVIDEKYLPRVKEIIKYHLAENDYTNMYNLFELRHLTQIKEILADDSIATVPENYARVFGSMDKVVQHRDDEGYSVGISMSSSRIYNFESLYTENSNGWYQGDGMLYIYNDQDEFDHNYWYNINPYHLPGTTVDTQKRELEYIAQGYEYLSSQDFVGGAETKEGYAAAAMALESFHNNIDYGPQPSNYTTYGGYPPVHDSSLTAKKAWFLFDDEVVALGADINSKNGINVETVIENRKTKNTISTLAGLDVEKCKIIAAEAVGTADQDGNKPENVFDGDLSTVWASEKGSTLTVDLGSVQSIGTSIIAFYNGKGRKISFDLETSADKITWSEPLSYVSDGTDTYSEYPINADARYIRFTGHGADVSTWNSIKEIELYKKMPDTVKFSVDNIQNLSTETISTNGVVWDKLYNEAQERSGVKYAHLEDYGGFYFPEAVTLHARRAPSTPSFNELWLDHGIDPEKAKYAYVILPNKSDDETAAYAQNPDIEILSNNGDIQAVRDKSSGATGIVFWKAGTFENITVDKPCIVMLTGDEKKEFSLSVSDPTHKLSDAKITVKTDCGIKNCDDKITAKTENGEKILNVDFRDTNGGTLYINFMIGAGENEKDNNNSGTGTKPDDGL